MKRQGMDMKLELLDTVQTCLSLCSLKVIPYNVFTFSSLGFFPVWEPQGSYTFYVVAGFSQGHSSKRIELGNCLLQNLVIVSFTPNFVGWSGHKVYPSTRTGDMDSTLSRRNIKVSLWEEHVEWAIFLETSLENSFCQRL